MLNSAQTMKALEELTSQIESNLVEEDQIINLLVWIRASQIKQIIERAINPNLANALLKEDQNKANYISDPLFNNMLLKLTAGIIFYDNFHMTGWNLFKSIIP